jgi:arabinose-5-phosphate isomerase|tara:strand:- start:1305 stop:2282 length:978 start_codon:yes stop_codon:yes gene_type:complete
MNKFCHIANAQEVLDVEKIALEHGKNNISESFNAALKLILNHSKNGRVIVMGMGKSGHIGKKIAATLASTGTPASFVHPAEAGHGDLGMITRRDVVIGISQSGNSDELLKVLPYLRRNDIKLIAMSGDHESSLAFSADCLIDTSVPAEACPLGLAPTASTTLTLALGDALAVCLLKEKGFNQDNFAETHPHGKLGRKLLLTVSDIMSPIDESPIITDDFLIKDALIVMSEFGLGFVIIKDKDNYPIGVYTDGDLRRSINDEINISTTTVKNVMQTNSITTVENSLAVDAVKIMEDKKVSAFPVVNEDGCLVGAINMRQILRSGVI